MSRIDAAGRLIVPAQARRAMQMEGGGPVVLSLVDGELRVRSVAAAMAALQEHAAVFLGDDAASVDAFLTVRRAEAARDDVGRRAELIPRPTDTPTGAALGEDDDRGA